MANGMKQRLHRWIARQEEYPLVMITNQLYLYAKRSLQFLLIVTILLIVLLLGHVPDSLLLLWGAPMLGLTAWRIHELSRYHPLDEQDREANQEALPWYSRFVCKALMTALLAGLSIPIFAPYLHDFHMTFILYFYVLGISAGALGALFSSAFLLNGYITLLSLPLILYLLLQFDIYALIISLVTILYVTVLLMIGRTTRTFMGKVYEQQKNLRVKEQELDLLFEQTPTPIFYFDTDLRIRKYNDAFRKFFRIPPEKKLDEFNLTQLHDLRPVEAMQEVLETGKPVSFEGAYFSTFTPREYWVEAKIAPLHGADGELKGGIVSFQDKTLIKQNIDRLQELASLDVLTNLGNRRKFLFALKELVESPRDDDRLSMLFFLDLNQFKPINDTLGHHFGDRVLQEVSRILKSHLPENTQLFRYGGDEFILLHPHCCADAEEAHARGRELARRINSFLLEEIVIDGYHLPMRCSIGVVIITPEMRDADEIVRHADISMYQAKSAQSDCAFYDPEMDRQRQKNFYLRQELNQPGIEGELLLHYQPIVSLESQSTVGAEALIRWEHPTLGLLYPDDFIPLAIESGEIGRIGQWVAEEVCRTLEELKIGEENSPLDYLSFNVDARELGYMDFPRHLKEALQRYRIDPSGLIIEITENSLIDNFQNIRSIIDELKELGVRWAIDDFGVGYSSLSYLQRLSLSLLKIDRSFTLSLEENPDTVFLVKHLLKIAQRLGYRIVVEGVETRAQVEILRGISSQVLCQGYYFSRPLDKERFLTYLQRENRENTP